MKAMQLTFLAAAGVSGSAFAVQYMTADQALPLMFPEATAFRDQSVRLTPEQMREIEQVAGLPARSAAWRVIGAYKGEALLGYMVLDEVIGKVELISYAVGLNPDASIRQVEILAYRESHGFEIRNAAWRKQFVGKHASADLAVGNGIANISGATLSCTHVTEGVRRIAAVGQVVLRR